MRLVWVAKGLSKFVFVNHQGRKVIELGLFKLATYFKEGRITVDSDYELPIVNQGLDDMVKDVYDKLAYQSSHDAMTGLVNKTEFCRQIRVLMKDGKRTSECSLLYIRFKDSENSQLVLAEGFANQVVKTLDSLSDKELVLGRLNALDFVVFSVLDDNNSHRIKAQEALIALCQKPENSKYNLMVVIGESRAHLGFNNPDSMIQHASEAFEALPEPPLEAAKQQTLVKTEEPARVENSDSEVNQVPPVVILDKAANADVNVQEFSELIFQLWGQSTSEIQSDGQGIKESVHLNLFNVIEGEKETYSAEQESCVLELDKWWIKYLGESEAYASAFI